MSGDLGRGTGSFCDVLKLEDGMNVADLKKQLNSMPSTGVLHVRSIQTVSEREIRIAVEIQGAILAGKEL